MEKYKSKAQLMWEVGKEGECNFRCKDIMNLSKKKIEEFDELMLLIRKSEYRRGKEDGIKEYIKEQKQC